MENILNKELRVIVARLNDIESQIFKISDENQLNVSFKIISR